MGMVCYENINGHAQTATALRNALGTHDPPFLLRVGARRELAGKMCNRKGGSWVPGAFLGAVAV